MVGRAATHRTDPGRLRHLHHLAPPREPVFRGWPLLNAALLAATAARLADFWLDHPPCGLHPDLSTQLSPDLLLLSPFLLPRLLLGPASLRGARTGRSQAL